jgi:phage recombination protein Bet
LRILRETIMPGATDAELDFFKLVCQRVKLDPFAKQIHAVSRQTKRNSQWVTVWSYQTGIDGFRLIAERTGEYRGQLPLQWCADDGVWRDVWLQRTPPRAARAAVLRAGFDEPMIAVAHYDEYVQTVDEYEDVGNGERQKTGQKKPNAMWLRMPAGQLAKCAEALAFRKAFPQELAGLYTNDEMGQADNDAGDDDVSAENRRQSSRRHRAQSQSGTNSGTNSATQTANAAPQNWTNGSAPIFPYGPERAMGITLDAVYVDGATRERKKKGSKKDGTTDVKEIVECGGQFVIADRAIVRAVEWIDSKFRKHEALNDAGDESMQTKENGWLAEDDQARLGEWRDSLTDEMTRRAAVLNEAAQGAVEDEQRENTTTSRAAVVTVDTIDSTGRETPSTTPVNPTATAELSDRATGRQRSVDDLPF